MKKIYFTFLVCLLKCGSEAANLPPLSVYVVTPSPGNHQSNEARSAPFYYHNWMRRMDSPRNVTTITTSTTPKVKTPDLIFAEFESENGNNLQKSIRKLLERERVESKKTSTTSTTTSQPIIVPESSAGEINQEIVYPQQEDTKKSELDMTDYFALYNNLYDDDKNIHVPKDIAPVYVPSTTSTTAFTTTTTTPAPTNIENIWHIIDSQKRNQYLDKWEEVPLNTKTDTDQKTLDGEKQQNNSAEKTDDEQEEGHITEDFALPGFGANPGNIGENESRAIRTEPNIQFPYVSLKPFQMKNMNKSLLNMLTNSKKTSNMFTSLDDFKEIKHPVRGEIQDIIPMRPPIDRYNPAQPYLPQEYGSKSKQSSPSSSPSKAVANLVPPPPPPPPRVTGDDFPAPTNYEPFPPYPSSIDSAPPPAPTAMNPPVSVYKSPLEISDNSGPDLSLENDSDNTPMDVVYLYEPPSPPSPPSFVPTLPPLSKPFHGYSYNKPTSMTNTPQAIDLDGYTYNKPAITIDSPPTMDMSGYTYKKPEVTFDSPVPMDEGGYSYNKPPEPAPPPSGPPMDDHGFPADFPGYFKFHHDIDDHDVHHYHTHPTTTTTTETPRVNRFSYYYLGKKLYYLPLYFSVYFIVYVGALIIKAVLRHKIVYPNSWRPNDTTAAFFSKRSVDSWDVSNENLHDITGRVTKAIGEAAEKYLNKSDKTK